MSNAEARPPQRTLNLGAAAPARRLPEPVGNREGSPTATATLASPRVSVPVDEPVDLITPARKPHASELAPPSLENLPVLNLPIQSAAPAQKTSAPARLAPAKPAKVMHRELDKPLGEIIRRRGPQEFKDLFRDLVAHGVSDVHMTRSLLEGTFKVEARVDGKMQLVHVYTGVEAQTIHTLIKTEAKMSSGVNLVPEDGSYDLPIDGYPYRARAVTLPLFDGGERVVFRLPQTGALRTIEELGFTSTNLAATKALLDIPGGMTLFAGPTGEGKSTTTLSSLAYLREQDNGVVITLEDPVERILPGVAQVEVNEEVEGAAFGDWMKFLVRSDANVLFIGEIRDRATATAAVEIAKSGRRVLATIHAKDNVSAYMRLMEMADAAPLSVLESMNGIVSQRLIPRLVPGTTRFAGRYPIHEVTTNSEELTDALVANTSRAAIRSAALKSSFTFRQNIDELVAEGITTLDAARKVVQDV